MLRRIKKLLQLSAITPILVLSMTSKVFAASVELTAESLSKTFQPDSSQIIEIYANAMDSNVYAVSAEIRFSGMTYVSYSPVGSAFNGFNGVTDKSDGGDAVTVAATYANDKSATGKQKIGDVVVKMAGSGTPKIQFEKVAAYSSDLNNVPASGEASSYSISESGAPSVSNVPAASVQVPDSGTAGGVKYYPHDTFLDQAAPEEDIESTEAGDNTYYKEDRNNRIARILGVHLLVLSLIGAFFIARQMRSQK